MGENLSITNGGTVCGDKSTLNSTNLRTYDKYIKVYRGIDAYKAI